MELIVIRRPSTYIGQLSPETAKTLVELVKKIYAKPKITKWMPNGFPKKVIAGWEKLKERYISIIT